MEDSTIVALFWARDEQAIAASDEKYGRYCTTVAMNILGEKEAVEECVNDTWLHAWNAIPPARPSVLRAFFGRITRNLSFDRYRRMHAGKRGGGEMEAILSELEECVSGGSVEAEIDRRELAGAINGFLRELPERKRVIFVCRYWYGDSVSDVARRFGMKRSAAAMTLLRIREQLKDYLLERGFEV